MVKEVAELSMMSRSVAWVAKEMVGSLTSNTLPAELNTRLPEVVVMMLRSAEVELMRLVPAPAISMLFPVPALVTSKTFPDDVAKDWVRDSTLPEWVHVPPAATAQLSAIVATGLFTVRVMTPDAVRERDRSRRFPDTVVVAV